MGQENTNLSKLDNNLEFLETGSPNFTMQISYLTHFSKCCWWLYNVKSKPSKAGNVSNWYGNRTTD